MDALRLLKKTVKTLCYIQEKGSHLYKYNYGRDYLKLIDVLQRKYIFTCDFPRTKCGYCLEQNPAVAYCKNCACFIDPLCVTYHNKIKTLLTHEVTQLLGKNEKEIKYQDLAIKTFCDKKGHEQFEYDSYCISCKDLVCRECREKHLNHDLNLLEDFYSLLDLILDVKRKTDVIIPLLRRDDRNNEFNAISATARIIDSVIKFQKDVSGDAIVQIMFKEFQVDEYKMLPVKDVYNKLKSMNGYLQQRLSEVPDDRGHEMEEGEQTEEESILNSGREANSAGQFGHANSAEQFGHANSAEQFVHANSAEQFENTNSAVQFGHLIMEHLSSFSSNQLFPSTSQPEDHSGPSHQKPPEQDIEALHQDMFNSFHLESFQNLHP